MADLDVSDISIDPDFADVAGFTVLRYTQSFDHGRLVKVLASTNNGVLGTICMASPNDLKRFPEGQITGKVISVVTPFRLHASAEAGATELLPDEIVWHGSTYVVIWVDDYAGFGQGQIQALAESKLKQDPAPPGSPP